MTIISKQVEWVNELSFTVSQTARTRHKQVSVAMPRLRISFLCQCFRFTAKLGPLLGINRIYHHISFIIPVQELTSLFLNLDNILLLMRKDIQVLITHLKSYLHQHVRHHIHACLIHFSLCLITFPSSYSKQ